MTGGRLFISVKDVLDQCAHDYFIPEKAWSDGYFIIATGEYRSFLLVAPDTYMYVHCHRSRKVFLREVLHMEEILIPLSAYLLDSGICSTQPVDSWENTVFSTTHMCFRRERFSRTESPLDRSGVWAKATDLQQCNLSLCNSTSMWNLHTPPRRKNRGR